ncbi:MAG: M14 family metallopeptidase [Bernardetiaceae bacterium]|nr:M14 family metallopeptidase [Bernardetiaceae bacterium]
MKKLFLLCLFGCFLAPVQAQELSYYLPDSVQYNPAIPSPETGLGHKVGEWHATHDKLIHYLKMLDAASDRLVFEETGRTYEGRTLGLLKVTSPKNHGNLEALRRQHLDLTDPAKAASLNLESLPLVVWLGYTIHGNEPSGVNAAILVAYYLAAAQGPAIDNLLENNIIIVDPCLNPDGMNRFASWANTHRSVGVLVTDPASREFNEMWPGARTNHYWFDLNRDWLPLQHLESQHRVAAFHQWRPNILTDHHEMGTNSTFFFQPGVPSRVNPNTPAKNPELTAKIGQYHAQFLNRIGSLYYTKEGFDDFYYGKGSTYPDAHGAVGILFEQGSSRGHAQESENGVVTFPFTIKNQFVTSLSTLEAAKNLRRELLAYQREFYQTAVQQAAAFPVKGYVFGDAHDRGRNFHFLELLRRHQIDVHALKTNYSADGQSFAPGAAYVVPTNQPQYRLVKTIFEKTLKYEDSLFYDVTTWTMPLAFGLPHAEVRAPVANLLGDKIDKPEMPKGEIKGGQSGYGYLFEYHEYYAPKALYDLLAKGLLVKTTTRQFELPVNGAAKKFDYGSVLVPVHGQAPGLSPERMFAMVQEVAIKNGLVVHALGTGLATTGPDLGSNYLRTVRKPSIMLLAGQGTSSYDVGEIWHLLDYRFRIPVSVVDMKDLGRADLSRYTAIVMANGNYNELSGNNLTRLKSWVQTGGTLVAIEDAVLWAARNGLSDVASKTAKPAADSTRSLPYVALESLAGAQEMGGSIFAARLDLTHPLAYGLTQPTVSVFKANKIFMKKSSNPIGSPLVYNADPLQSGYISKQNYDQVKNSAVINVTPLGRGRVLSFADNLNFRAFWYGGNKLFLNALFFGPLIQTSTRFGED